MVTRNIRIIKRKNVWLLLRAMEKCGVCFLLDKLYNAEWWNVPVPDLIHTVIQKLGFHACYILCTIMMVYTLNNIQGRTRIFYISTRSKSFKLDQLSNSLKALQILAAVIYLRWQQYYIDPKLINYKLCSNPYLHVEIAALE